VIDSTAHTGVALDAPKTSEQLLPETDYRETMTVMTRLRHPNVNMRFLPIIALFTAASAWAAPAASKVCRCPMRAPPG